MSNVSKGRATMQMAKRCLEARGALWIETAVNAAKWVPGPQGMRPISVRHDFFGLWDAICARAHHGGIADGRNFGPGRVVYFVQATAVGDMARRRTKILESGFPCVFEDLLMGYRGRGKFRVLRGPRFDGAAEEWKAPRRDRKAPRRDTSPGWWQDWRGGLADQSAPAGNRR